MKLPRPDGRGILCYAEDALHICADSAWAYAQGFLGCNYKPLYRVHLALQKGQPGTVNISTFTHCWQYHGVNKLAELNPIVGPNLFKVLKVPEAHQAVFLQYMWNYFAGGFRDMNPPKAE